MLKPAFLLLLAVLVTGAGAADAATTPTAVTAAVYPPTNTGWVRIHGGPTINQIAVSRSGPSALLVSDATAGVTATPKCASGAPTGYDDCGCEQLDAMTATCTNPYGTGINVSLEAGDDTLRVSSPTRVYARGGDGSDRLTAGSGNDALGDQGGNDRMSGRQGNDTLVPGRGHDSAFGGAGDDYLLLHNGDRDRRIDCGRGNDHAVIDRRLDPPPLDCEHVSYSR